jgi:hypothetical protein
MKKILLIISAVVMSTLLSGQNFKISVAPTINNAFYFQGVDGLGSYMSKAGISTSIGYYIRQDKKISLAVGLSYQFAQIKYDPMFNGVNDPLPYSESFNLISLNIGAIYNFKKDFYLSLDPTVDLELDSKTELVNDDQTGLGISFGVGKNIKLNDNLRLSIEPRLWIHNLVPMQDTNLPLRLTVAGLNIGLIL